MVVEKVAVSHLYPKEFRASEALKTLRTNLVFSGSSVRAIGVTSFGAAAGKSTISMQIALAFAQTGKRVLLVDADMRKSVLPTRLRVKGKLPGLSHYLSGQSNVSELLCETDVANMYIMFAGTRVPNSAELLSSDNFARLIPALKEVFDYIIVDTAPLGQVIDCAVIAQHLDGVAMVVDATTNSYKLERRVKNQIIKAGGKVLGVILNQVDARDYTGYYGYGKRYGGYYYANNKED
jgi:capsular exopolysaccharide synthesis family protein